MKKFISLLISALIAVSAVTFKIYPVNVSAVEYNCGKNMKWSLDAGTGEMIITGSGRMYDYDSSTSGGAPWRNYKGYIKTVEIEEGITNICDYAFSKCTNLNSVTLPSTLLSIGENAFESTAIKTVDLPDGLKYIEKNAFKGSSLTEIYIPESVYNIETGCFQNCSRLKKISIPSKLYELDIKNVFNGTSSLETILFPNGCNIINIVSAIDDEFSSKWYNDIASGCVYFGNVLIKYKGTVSADTAIEVKEGTRVIAHSAFRNQQNLTHITVPDSVFAIGEYALDSTAWYNNMPDGDVYLGNVYYKFNGQMEIGQEVHIKEGTLGIAGRAFYGQDLLEKITFPDSLIYIGPNAFYHTIRLYEIPIESGLEYLDNYALTDTHINYITVPATIKYIGVDGLSVWGAQTVSISFEQGYSLPEIKSYVFPSNMKTLVIPSCVERICTSAFSNMDYADITIPETVIEIEKYAFSNAIDPTVYCYADSVAHEYVVANSIDYVLIDGEIEEEIVFSALDIALKNAEAVKRELYTEKSLAVLDSAVSQVNTNAEGLTQETVDGWNKSIRNAISALEYKPADYHSLEIALERADSIERGLYTAESLAKLDEMLKSGINKNLDITNQATVDGYADKINLLVDSLEYKSADYSNVDSLISRANGINRSIYTAESLAKLDAATASVDRKLNITEQARVDAYADAIEAAIKALEIAKADFSVVEALVEKSEKINRNIYTKESLEALDNAVAAVNYDITKENQSQVAVWALAIDDALKNLEYSFADYTAVEDAVKKANKTDRILYTSESLAILDQSVSAVVYDLKIDEQTRVDGYAQSINKALSLLVYAEVSLKNEPNGIIVSATAKEIHPETTLAVDKLDPSNIENANFAVGGNIKSVNYFDINLIRDSRNVQPDGTVKVKVKIPGGVKPEKCRIYHVTDDPVDPLVRFASTLDGNYIVFETDHFSGFAIIEIEIVPEKIEIKKLPAKTVYAAGEAFSTDGMTVEAYMSDGSVITVTDYDVSNVDTSVNGEKTVTVYYTHNGQTKSTTFKITVNSGAEKPTEQPKPVEPTEKPTEQAKPVNAMLRLKESSTDTLDYGETLILHAEAELSEGMRLVWTADGNAVTLTPSADGMTCAAEATGNGDVTVTVTVINSDGTVFKNADGEEVSVQKELNIKGGFFKKIISFFKNLFGIDRVIAQIFKTVF